MNARLRLRWAAFVAFVVLANTGPLYRNTVDSNARTLDWDMFSAKGLNRCAIRYLRADGDALVPVDGLAAMGYRQRADAPLSWRQPEGPGEARTLARRLCRALGPPTDVRVELRCATPGGWVTRTDTTERVCTR